MTVLGLRPKTHADLERAREKIDWVDDDDLGELESKSRLGAALLGFFTWGGGRIYLGDLAKGFGLIGLLFAWVALAPLLPAALGPLVYMLVGAGSAAWSYRGSRAVNRFVSTRTDLQLRAGPDPSAYRLLAAAASVNPNLAPPPQLGAPPAPATCSAPRRRRPAPPWPWVPAALVSISNRFAKLDLPRRRAPREILATPLRGGRT